MSTDIDWQHELDSSFGTGHDLAPDHYLASGRRAVRRRRATAVVLASAIVVCGTAVWASGPGSALRGEAPVANERVDSRQVEVTEPDEDPARLDKRVRQLDRMRQQAEKPSFIGNPATLVDGELVLAPKAGPVLQQVANPMDYAAGSGRTSIGIRVMFEGREKYSLIATEDDERTASTSLNTVSATGDFAGWLAAAVNSQRSLDQTDAAPDTSVTETPDAWLSLGPDGSIESASPFVAVMEVREGVDLGDGFALDADRVGAARLQVAGTSEFVVWRAVRGRLEVIGGPGPCDSLSAFVRWAREQYASGQGLR